MQQRRRGTATLWGRLAVLSVFASGFLTMHGFLAVSASADVHVANAHHVAGEPTAHAAAAPQATLAAAPSAAEGDIGAAPAQPSPAEHHDLVAGCVVALVGTGLVGLALLSLRRSSTTQTRSGLVSAPVQAIRAATARWSPPRVALCVIRV